MDLSVEAVGLWTLAGSWCAKYLTDGFVPEKTIRRLGGGPDLASELYASGLWEARDGGWQFKDWTDYQPSKAEVEAERQAARDRMKKVRAAKKGVGKSADGSGELPANEGGSSEEVRIAPSQPSPSPDLSLLTSHREPSVGKGVRGTRGTRIPAPFVVTTAMRQWAAENVPTVDVDASTQMFVDHWRAESGAKASKLDWVATWRNWLRRDAKNRRPANQPTKLARADENAAEFYRLYGGDDERTGSVQALDPGIG